MVSAPLRGSSVLNRFVGGESPATAGIVRSGCGMGLSRAWLTEFGDSMHSRGGWTRCIASGDKLISTYQDKLVG